jgi:hypothetical protein
MTNKAPFCAFLWLSINVLARPKTSAISVNPVIMFISSSCPSCASWLKNPFNQRNLRLINDLRSTKVYVRKNKLFLQNEPNFRKSQMNVTVLLIRKYVQMDTWSIRKNEPKTNPNEPKTNPKPKKSKMNLTACLTTNYEQRTMNDEKKRTQTNPKRTQFQSKTMLLPMLITGRPGRFGYSGVLNVVDKTSCIWSVNLVTISKHSRSNKMQLLTIVARISIKESGYV